MLTLKSVFRLSGNYPQAGTELLLSICTWTDLTSFHKIKFYQILHI